MDKIEYLNTLQLSGTKLKKTKLVWPIPPEILGPILDSFSSYFEYLKKTLMETDLKFILNVNLDIFLLQSVKGINDPLVPYLRRKIYYKPLIDSFNNIIKISSEKKKKLIKEQGQKEFNETLSYYTELIKSFTDFIRKVEKANEPNKYFKVDEEQAKRYIGDSFTLIDDEKEDDEPTNLEDKKVITPKKTIQKKVSPSKKVLTLEKFSEKPLDDIVCIKFVEQIYKELNKDTKEPSTQYFIKTLHKVGVKDILGKNELWGIDLEFLDECRELKTGYSNKQLRMKYWEIIDYIRDAEIKFPLQL
jgi:hypothetical protein